MLGVIIKTLRLDQTSAGHNEDTRPYTASGISGGYFAFICLFFVVPSPTPTTPRGKTGSKEVLAAQTDFC